MFRNRLIKKCLSCYINRELSSICILSIIIPRNKIVSIQRATLSQELQRMIMKSALAIKITSAIMLLKSTKSNVVLSVFQPLDFEVFLLEDKVKENEIARKISLAKIYTTIPTPVWGERILKRKLLFLEKKCTLKQNEYQLTIFSSGFATLKHLFKAL